MRRIFPAVALVVLSWIGGCAPGAPDSRSAVLITIDTWRADRFGAGGHPGVRTPHLDRFFRGGTQFSEAYSSIPTTLASHASMLSAEWPSGHGVPRNGWPVPDELETIAEILRGEGFSTGAFVSSAALDPQLNLDQGFDVYDYATPLEVSRDQSWREASETLERAEQWWKKTYGPRFLWVPLFEPHFPYDPDPIDFALYDTGYRGEAEGSMDYLFALWEGRERLTEDASAHLESLYHAEITGLDRTLRSFLRVMEEERGLLIILTSDHGESLGEHGLQFKHGPHVFPGDVRIPLVVRGAAPFAPGLSDAMVRTIDFPRTFLDQLGVRADLPPDAGSLTEWARGGNGRTVFAEASMPWNVEVAGAYANAYKQRAVRTPRWSLVVTPWTNQKLWFDRHRDPDELAPGPEPGEAEARRLGAALDEWARRGSARPAPSTVDSALVGRLRALGYID
jgi:arylsulfatase A-like enzyme